ncbi:MAG: CotH kinase family protein [Bacteroidota bacterium]
MRRTLLTCLIFLTVSVQFLISQKNIEVPDFYKTDKIQEIKITFKENNWQYVLDSLRFNGDGYQSAKVNINGQVFEGAGVQFRGTKSFRVGANRNPMNIRLNHTDEHQNLDGYTTVKLSSALRDPSMVREVLGYEIARNYMPAPWANYAKVTVNGEYYGLFVNIESVQDPAFRKRYFDGASNAFFKANEVLKNEDVDGCKNNIYGSLQYDEAEKCYMNNFRKFSKHGTGELLQMVKVLNQAPDKIGSMLNVDVTLWMHAFNNVLVNLSSYSGNRSVNYYLYKDNKNQFTPIIWDMNLAFGSYKNIGNGSDLKTRQLYSLDPLLHTDNELKPLIQRLLADPYNKKLYLSHVRTILYDYFENDKYLERAKELQSLITADFANDLNRYYELDDFNNSLEKVIGRKSKVPGLKWLMDKRADFLKIHPQVSVLPSEITDINVQPRERMSVKQVDNFKISANVGQFPKKVVLHYRLEGKKEFKSVNMISKEDGKFEVVVTPSMGERSIDYYIVAENASMVSHSPTNYMWEYHHVSLDELNK